MYLPLEILERVITFLDPEKDPYTHFFLTDVLADLKGIPRSERRCIPENLTCYASMDGYINLLQYWKYSLPSLEVCPTTRNILFPPTSTNTTNKFMSIRYGEISTALEMACSFNQVDVLDWWVLFYQSFEFVGDKEREILLGYDQITAAARTGSIAVLDWWIIRAGSLNSLQKSFPPTSALFWLNTHDLTLKDWPLSTLLWIDQFHVRFPQFDNEYRMQCNQPTLEWLCKHNRIDELNWWKQHYSDRQRYMFTYCPRLMREATQSGHLEVLQWWLNHSVEFQYPFNLNPYIPVIASTEGHEHILHFLLEHQPEVLRASCNAINGASRNGHMHILRWWKLFCDAMDRDIPYNRWAVDYASENGHIAVLDWWAAHDSTTRTFLSDDDNKRLRALLYTSHAIDYASANGHIHVLNWWIQWMTSTTADPDNVAPAPTLKWTRYAMDVASANGRIEVLDWWLHQQNQMQLVYTLAPLDVASRQCRLDVLEWWRNSGLDLRLTMDFMYDLKLKTVDEEPDVYCWWKTHYPQYFENDE